MPEVTEPQETIHYFNELAKHIYEEDSFQTYHTLDSS